MMPQICNGEVGEGTATSPQGENGRPMTPRGRWKRTHETRRSECYRRT
jgi:hypothetical protein